ncbi:hypothetical protein ATY41_09770 [Leifsonia xyli subsp. xyli]|uniref:RNA polymerase, sigma factor n=2 Tax=Leifsonia xyli subsp. xyli TaxID=59736 RepID=Q6AGB5_LEIXX|nr:sigma-70 family RNA polymerase sigma factor [Leifsonia xyli]AAT88580.1 RNA polymerase, sigma factor [Leifsonia xyli subsp. xyli str. CTCB07]ODA90523.1 hypothetical protein ATY41_09770 [Leifsonia xyli subsp. xyli]
MLTAQGQDGPPHRIALGHTAEKDSVNTKERDRLVTDHLPLVGYIVSDLCMKAAHLDRDELASAGNLALPRAFDPDKGVTFASYARTRISGAISDELRSKDWVSRGMRKRIKAAQSARDDLAKTLGRTPTEDEVASLLGIGKKALAEAMHHQATGPVSFDDLAPDEAAEITERDVFLRTAVEALPDRLRLVVTRIFCEERQVKDVAAELGITHAAVSMTKSEAVRMLHEGWVRHFDAAAGQAPSAKMTPKRTMYLNRLADMSKTAGPVLESSV